MSEADGDTSTQSRPLLGGVEAIGARWLRFQRSVGGVWFLLVDAIYWIARAATNRRVRIGRAAIVSQVVRLGVRSIGIVTLLSVCIGAILALQMEPPLEDFGQVDKIANIIGIAVFRELGPLITAVVLTGFAGAAVAAEIGTMVVGEEIEALEAHALNPIRFLVVPRVIATTFSTLCLTVFADAVAVLAGMFVSVYVHGVSAALYWENTKWQVEMADVTTGLLKAVVFGLLIGLISCFNGLRVTGGAAGVGRATTDTVVASIVSIIFADLIFTTFFFVTGWV
ncbi:MAG: MlaE family ABC transporter permease [Phycisphaerales bacterium]